MKIAVYYTTLVVVFIVLIVIASLLIAGIEYFFNIRLGQISIYACLIIAFSGFTALKPQIKNIIDKLIKTK